MRMKCKYLGGAGVLQVPADMTQKLEAGVVYNVDISKQRSTRQHNMLFRAIEVAFENWPEHHWFQPLSDDHLRYWLEVRAGWGTAVPFDNPQHAVHYLCGKFNEKVFPAEHDGKIVVYQAASIAYGKLGRTDFNELVTRLDRVLQEEAGMSLAECGLSASEDAR